MRSYSVETNRDSIDESISAFDLHDTYLPQYLLLETKYDLTQYLTEHIVARDATATADHAECFLWPGIKLHLKKERLLVSCAATTKSTACRCGEITNHATPSFST